MVHCYKLGGLNIVLDICSGSVHVVDEVVYDVIEAYESRSKEEIIAEMQFDYIRKKADSGESFVIVGRCADTVLKNRPEMISIFITGDKECKINRIMNVFGIDKNSADSKRKRHDKTRKQYHNAHSSFKWGDSRYYDVCINSSKLGEEITADLLETYIKERISKM